MEEQSTPSQAPEPTTMGELPQKTPASQQGSDWRKWCVGLGGLMMLLSLLLSAYIPVPGDMLYFANRAFMSLGGGLLAGGVVGFIEIETRVLQNVVRGGGGFAVFLVLFLINPPALTAIAAAPPARKEDFPDAFRRRLAV